MSFSSTESLLPACPSLCQTCPGIASPVCRVCPLPLGFVEWWLSAFCVATAACLGWGDLQRSHSGCWEVQGQSTSVAFMLPPHKAGGRKQEARRTMAVSSDPLPEPVFLGVLSALLCPSCYPGSQHLHWGLSSSIGNRGHVQVTANGATFILSSLH
jgi:hypothetical protein